MAREPSPIESKPGAVPARNGLCAHEDQGLFPPSPKLSSEDPKELVKHSQAGPGVLALEGDELLAERKVFEQEAPA
jgi:hypothetical protein